MKQFKKIKEEIRGRQNDDQTDDDYIEKNHLFNSTIVDSDKNSLYVMETPLDDNDQDLIEMEDLSESEKDK